MSSEPYPVTFDVDYPGELSRLTTALRLIWAIPAYIIATLISGVGNLIFPVLLTILFRQKYPRWWFDALLEYTRFNARLGAYATLLTDRYPSTDEEQAVHLAIPYPDVERDLSRWMPLVKWILAIPHYIVLLVLSVIVFILVIIAWFAILFTGRYPRGMFNFVVGVSRWWQRVNAYAFLLTTDRYPPFSLT